MVGTIGGWQEALKVVSSWGTPLHLTTLLTGDIHHTDAGVVVTQSQEALTAKHIERLCLSPGFSEALLLNDQVPREGEDYANCALPWPHEPASGDPFGWVP